MLGFGELFAHELAFRFGWSGTKVGLFSRRERGTHADGDGIDFPNGEIETDGSRCGG
jgi:hypothetical protein